MSAQSEAVNDPKTEQPKVMTSQKPTRGELLLEQYKLLEERRKYFGNQFMQTVGGVAVIVSVLIGVLGSKSETGVFPGSAMVFAGIALILLAFLAYRLGKRQDDCELAIARIEQNLKSIGYPDIVNMPGGAKRGARSAIEVILFLFGLGLIGVGSYVCFH